MEGRLIVIEGIDGAGKSTLIDGLKTRLRGRKVVFSREPSGGKYGRKLRELLRKGKEVDVEEEYRLFLLDRKNHVRYFIRPWLKKGYAVVLDRYYLSTAAYQGARGKDPERIIEENRAFAPEPHLVIFMDLDPVLALRRKGKGSQRFEEANFLRKVRQIYLSLLSRFPHVILDASRPPEALVEEALRAVEPLIC